MLYPQVLIDLHKDKAQCKSYNKFMQTKQMIHGN